MLEWQIRDVFTKRFKGKANWMSTEILRYGCQGDWLYELSTGTLASFKLWGVTILSKTGERPEPELSKACGSEAEAEEYIRSLDQVKAPHKEQIQAEVETVPVVSDRHDNCPSCDFSNHVSDSPLSVGYEKECEGCGKRFFVSPA